MKFKYRYFRDTSGLVDRYIKLPLLAVRLDYRGKQTAIVGLVDTGATDCLFDRDIADDLGITLSSADATREYVGVGGESVVGHVHRIKLQIKDSLNGLNSMRLSSTQSCPTSFWGKAVSLITMK